MEQKLNIAEILKNKPRGTKLYSMIHGKCSSEAVTDVLKYFRDNGELKKAYEIQKDSLTNMANSPWAKLVIGMFTSKVQEDKVDVELPDIDALIKENTSDEFIEKKINDILGNNTELKEES